MILEVENLHFSYGNNEVLRGISFSIERPTIFGIIGANGSGKTTLIKNISGYLRSDSGIVKIFGKEIERYTRKERAQIMGYVPQDIPFDFDFTAYDIVMMGRLPYLGRFQRESSKDRDIVKKAMVTTDTWDFREKTLRELSGGERQRVYIARALAQEAKILLMDEPVAHLDIRYQLEILSIVRDLVKKGITCIIVLHDINLASLFCDDVLILKRGKVLVKGKPEDVIREDIIKEAFNIDVKVIIEEESKKPFVIPLRKV